VADLREFRGQRDLRELLTKRYPTLRDRDEYIIFDLRERLDADEKGTPGAQDE